VGSGGGLWCWVIFVWPYPPKKRKIKVKKKRKKKKKKKRKKTIKTKKKMGEGKPKTGGGCGTTYAHPRRKSGGGWKKKTLVGGKKKGGVGVTPKNKKTPRGGLCFFLGVLVKTPKKILTQINTTLEVGGTPPPFLQTHGVVGFKRKGEIGAGYMGDVQTQ